VSSGNEPGSERVATKCGAVFALTMLPGPTILRHAAKISGVLTIALGIASLGVHLTQIGRWQSLWHEEVLTGIAPQQGYAFLAVTGHPTLSAHLRPSPAAVLENGVWLGPSNAQHADIRSLGRGRFSFWNDYVYFSSSDLSDPRTNGRRYTIRYPPIDHVSASVLYVLTGISFLIGGGVWIAVGIPPLLGSWRRLARRTRSNIARVARSREPNQRYRRLFEFPAFHPHRTLRLELNVPALLVVLFAIPVVLSVPVLIAHAAGAQLAFTLGATSVIAITSVLVWRRSLPSMSSASCVALALCLVFFGSRAALEVKATAVGSMAILGATVLEAVALVLFVRDDRVGASVSGPSPLYLRLVTAVAVFVAALVVSNIYHHAFSSLISIDSGTYWTTPRDLFKPDPGNVPMRTPIYSFMITAVQFLGGSGQALLWLQFGIRALSAALMAWLLSGSSLFAGAFVGGLLAVDPVGAANSASYLTEGVFSSALVLALVLVVYQLNRPQPPPSWQLYAAGISFAVAFLIRPITAALIVFTIAAYVVVHRSLRSGALVAAGYATIALSIALFNYVKYGLFTILASGLYFAFPLFIHGLFNPDNGRASRVVLRQLKYCDPNVDYSNVTLETANTFVWTKLVPCTLRLNGGNVPGMYRLYGTAYREAFFAHPGIFIWRLSLESARFLSVTVAYYPDEVGSVTLPMNVEDVCEGRGVYRHYGPLFLRFMCPVNAPSLTAAKRLLVASRELRLAYQPYLYVYDPRIAFESFVEMQQAELTGAAAILFFVFAWAVSRPAYRSVIIAAVLMILFNAAATAFGQVTMRRYAAPLSPFFLIVTGLLLSSVVEEAYRAVRRSPALVSSWTKRLSVPGHV